MPTSAVCGSPRQFAICRENLQKAETSVLRHIVWMAAQVLIAFEFFHLALPLHFGADTRHEALMHSSG